jgi:hypothetical protein
MEKAMADAHTRDKQRDDRIEQARTHSPENSERKRVGPAETIRERDEQIAEQVRQQVEQEQTIPAPGEPAGGE